MEMFRTASFINQLKTLCKDAEVMENNRPERILWHGQYGGRTCNEILDS